MKNLGRIVAVIVALLVFAGGSAYAAPGAQQVTGGHWQAHMTAQNGSGEDGTVTMTAVDATHTEVIVQLTNGTSTPQPAHVHEGTCANLNPTPKYPLNNVVNGMSDTTIAVGLDTLVHGGFAVNVHKSAAEVSTYVSCGDSFVNTAAGGTNTGGGTTLPTTGNGTQPLMLAGLALLVLALLGAGWQLRRVAR